MKHRNLTSGALLAVLAAASLGAIEVPPFTQSPVRDGAMGGIHVALADDYGLLFANPAALADARSQLFVSRVGVQASGPLFDIAQAYLGGGSLLASFTDVLAANDYQLYAAADVTGPLSFGYVGKGIGFGLFNRTRAVVDATGLSSVRVRAEEDVLLVGGYAFGLDLGPHHRVAFGVLAKGFARGGVVKNTDALSIPDLVADPLGLPFQLTTGIGVDVGLRWAWSAGLAAGLACRDLYSPALVSTYSSVQGFLDNPETARDGEPENGVLSRDLALGLSYSLPSGALWGLVDGLVIALDYGRILELFSPFPRNPVLNLGLGVEARMLDIITLRGGIYEGYPNAGISLDLAVARVGMSFFGRELGQEPGARPLFNLATSIEFVY